MYLGRYLLTYMPLISQLIIYSIYIVSGEYTYDILGYVFKISINQELHYSDTDLGNQFGYQLPNVKIFASNPLHDAFTSNFGNIWDLNVNEVAINGILEIHHQV